MTNTPPPGDPDVPPQQPYGQQSNPQYSQPVPPPGAPFTVQQDIDLAKWAHLSTILYWLPPLIIWLVGKDRGPRTNGEGKEALNFGITATIFVIAVQIVFFWILGWIPFAGIVFGIIGWLAHLAIWVFVIIWAIQGYQTVQAGGAYRYRVNFRFIK